MISRPDIYEDIHVKYKLQLLFPRARYTLYCWRLDMLWSALGITESGGLRTGVTPKPAGLVRDGAHGVVVLTDRAPGKIQLSGWHSTDYNGCHSVVSAAVMVAVFSLAVECRDESDGTVGAAHRLA